ncbi:MAG TPA: hypothetical protein VKA91_04465 [Nitrososphaeraceae archaeon]|nr:hypothetical protein [Nitrososphaeraceae archaeon]
MVSKCVESDHLFVGDEVEYLYKGSHTVMTVIGRLRRPRQDMRLDIANERGVF